MECDGDRYCIHYLAASRAAKLGVMILAEAKAIRK